MLAFIPSNDWDANQTLILSRGEDLNLRPNAYEALAPPAKARAHDRNRTDNLSLTKGLLYQLSYMGFRYGGQVYH